MFRINNLCYDTASNLVLLSKHVYRIQIPVPTLVSWFIPFFLHLSWAQSNFCRTLCKLAISQSSSVCFVDVAKWMYMKMDMMYACLTSIITIRVKYGNFNCLYVCICAYFNGAIWWTFCLFFPSNSMHLDMLITSHWKLTFQLLITMRASLSNITRFSTRLWV